jgi:RimJ/RimL family protein N-acetyltransferase
MKLETQRLILREFTEKDLDAFAALLADPEVMRFSLKGPIKDKFQAQEYLQKRILDHYSKYGYGVYAAIDKTSQSLVGYIGFLNQNIDGEHKTELGYRLFPNYWGKGLATEAAQELCRYAFDHLGVDELISIIEPLNVRSSAVAKRIGMSLWKSFLFYSIPVHIFALKKSAWNLFKGLVIRELKAEDIEGMANTFTFPWSTLEATLHLWQQYFKEQTEGIRTVFVFERQNQYLGYGSLLRVSDYPLFKDLGIPEINALWIDENYQGLGLGTRLINDLENRAHREGYKMVGIGVGLYKDYGRAQKLYSKLGYHLDGNGATYKCLPVTPGEKYPIDDDLLLWLTKKL